MKKMCPLILLVTIIFNFTNVNLAQAPDLKTASSFVLFTAGGAFNNIGATNATGNVGTNVGAFSGFPPGFLVGDIHVADSVSAKAATDVDAAYTFLNGNACGVFIGNILGNNLTLTPDVYCLGGAPTTLNDTLILDGQGNPDALFIFKMSGAFSVNELSTIILINSASSCNIYWQINGAFELKKNSVFKGTILANGAISLLDGSSIEGRGLSRLGEINIFSVNAALPDKPTLLPIELLSFAASPKGDNVQVDWVTTTEINNNYFTVQRSSDGFYFEEVQQIKGAGNNSSLRSYSLIDTAPYDGNSYYRLKQTDFDGKITYSNLVNVYFEKSFDFNIYPNPFNTSTTIAINSSQINSCNFKLYTILGEEVLNEALSKQSNTVETSNLPSGIYIYKIISNNKVVQSGKLVSNK